MSPTIRLGKLFGIEIGFNWSLLFVFLLIAWSLASAFPSQVPGRPAAEYWIAAIIGAAAFYVCLLIHELSHALVARRQGVPVSGITLWLFGGVSNLGAEPRSAAAEAAITVVGPVSSLVLAGICFVLALVMPSGLAADLLSWLAFINLTLGLFNLVPAFPLDGGRLLSSLLWWRGGTRRQAVHRAVQVGRVFAYVMIGLGLVELVTGSIFSGAWIVFLGWFLLSAASAEDTGAEQRELLTSVPVSAAMTSPVVTVPDWLTVEDFLAQVAPRYPFTTYPLHDPGGRITGVARLGDLLAKRAGTLREASGGEAGIQRARPDEDLEAVIERAGPNLSRRILVFDGDRLVGIVSPVDVGRLLAVRRAR